jgi:hypothetical protein
VLLVVVVVVIVVVVVVVVVAVARQKCHRVCVRTSYRVLLKSMKSARFGFWVYRG